MTVAKLSLLLPKFLAVVVICAAPVVAAPAGNPPENSPNPASGADIFTPPAGESERVPTFADDTSTRNKVRKALLGNEKEGIPSFHQIKEIPSLTGVQRQQLKQIYTRLKDEGSPMMEQLKAYREKYKGGAQQVMADPAEREKFQDLRRQIRELRTQSWQQVKALLTEQQLKELDAMHRGELTPSTFNEPKMTRSH